MREYAQISHTGLIHRNLQPENVVWNSKGRPPPFSFQVADSDFCKSSWSKNNPKTCVEVAVKPEGVAVRDSKDPDKNTLYFTLSEWDAFIHGAKSGEFDR
jgi:hypothetical protein